MRVFLSYHAPDARKAEALKAAIEAKEPQISVFVAHQSQRHGAYWQPQLSGALAEADAFIILVGKSIGQWQLPEYYAAYDRFNNLAPTTNKAHALMFLGRAKEAQDLYLKYKGQRVAEDMGLWEEEVFKDFDKLEKAGVTHPQMAEIRKILAPGPKKK